MPNDLHNVQTVRPYRDNEDYAGTGVSVEIDGNATLILDAEDERYPLGLIRGSTNNEYVEWLNTNNITTIRDACQEVLDAVNGELAPAPSQDAPNVQVKVTVRVGEQLVTVNN